MTLGSAILRADAGVGNAVGLRQRFGDLVLGADAQLDEHFAEQLLVAAAFLFVQRAVQLLLLDEALGQQQLSQRFSFECGDHGKVTAWSSGPWGDRPGIQSGAPGG
jgi:hypothetical protein